VIDEAQNLSEPVLESIRLLSDFETSKGKLLQIILAGQRQLIDTLTKPGMLQLTQRISVANFSRPAGEALQLIAEESVGAPRNINNICFGALSTAFALGEKRIDPKIIEEVAGEQSLRLLVKRMPQSLGPAIQRNRLSAFENKLTQKLTLHRIFRSGWFGKQARGAV